MMIDGMLKSVFAILGIDADEAGQMVRDVQTAVKDIDTRLSEITKNQFLIMEKLGIEREVNGEPKDDNGS